MSLKNGSLALPHFQDFSETPSRELLWKQSFNDISSKDTSFLDSHQGDKLLVLEPRVQTDSLHYWRSELDKKLANSYLSSVDKSLPSQVTRNCTYSEVQNFLNTQDVSDKKPPCYLSNPSSFQAVATVDFSKKDPTISVHSISSIDKTSTVTVSSRSSSDNEPAEGRVNEYYKGPVFMALSRNTSNRRHICEVCQKRFSRPSSLKTHMYTHTGEKPFLCAFEGCHKRFSVESNLRRHLRLHVIPPHETNGTEGL